MTRAMGIDGYLVLSILAAAPEREWYADELAKAAGTSHGLVSRLLERLKEQGWARDRWEGNTPSRRRQPRHYYRLHEAAIPEVVTVLEGIGRRVQPLIRWASPDLAADALSSVSFEPSGLSGDEISERICVLVEELHRRAATAARKQAESCDGGVGTRDVPEHASVYNVPAPRPC